MPSNQSSRNLGNFYQGLANCIFVASIIGAIGFGVQSCEHKSYKPVYETSSGGAKPWNPKNTAAAVTEVGAGFAGGTAGGAATLCLMVAGASGCASLFMKR